MDHATAETLYLRRRIRQSLAMAAAANGPCAQIAHETLARLYAEALDAIPVPLVRRAILSLRPGGASALRQARTTRIRALLTRPVDQIRIPMPLLS